MRGDFLYRLWKPRTQATVDFVLYCFFFFPRACCADLLGLEVRAALELHRGQRTARRDIPIYQFKTVIAVAGVLLLVQGIAQMCRCVLCMREGYWREADDDVQETEELLAKQKVLPAGVAAGVQAGFGGSARDAVAASKASGAERDS